MSAISTATTCRAASASSSIFSAARCAPGIFSTSHRARRARSGASSRNAAQPAALRAREADRSEPLVEPVEAADAPGLGAEMHARIEGAARPRRPNLSRHGVLLMGEAHCAVAQEPAVIEREVGDGEAQRARLRMQREGEGAEAAIAIGAGEGLEGE